MPEENRIDPPPIHSSLWKDFWAVIKIMSMGIFWLVLMILTYYSLLTIPIFLLVICLGVIIYRSARERKQHEGHLYDQDE